MAVDPGLPPVDVVGLQADDWLELAPDGVLLVHSGKVEIGTGLRTALEQIVAEELDLPLARVRVTAARTDRSPDEGYTAGSRSIRDSSRALRQVCADVRAALIGRAAALRGVDRSTLTTAGGAVLAPDGTRLPYEQLLVDGRLDVSVSAEATPKSPDRYSIVGTSPVRSDLLPKLTGGPAFVSDVRLPGMLHARMVRPPRPGVRLLDVEVGELPGDARVVRERDLLAVVASVEHDAVVAATRVRPIWSDDAPLVPPSRLFRSMVDGETDDAVLLADGDVDAAMGAADVTMTAEYRWPFHAHASIGPAVAVADVGPGSAIVHAAAQGVHPLRRGIAALLGLDAEAVTVIHGEGPGCYGHNGADDAAADAAVVSPLVGRPVRVQWTREDELVWARKGPATLVRLRGGVAADGRLLGVAADIWTPTHGGRAATPERFIAGYLRAGVDEPEDRRYVGGERNALLDYRIENHHVTMHWIPRPVLPSSSLRALGATANTFANESFMDELAEAAGLDPLELRLRNLDDPRAREVLERAADAAGWGRPRPAGTGLGLAFVRYEHHGAYVATVAEAELDGERLRIRRIVVAQDCGLVISPDGVRNQVEGNVVQSLSRAVLEEVRWDERGILSRDWETYPILRFSDLPEVETVLIDRPGEPSLGVGEPATATTAPAIANAIRAAGGPRLRQAPFAPDWRLRSDSPQSSP